MNKYLKPTNYWRKFIYYFDVWDQRKINHLVNKKQSITHNGIEHIILSGAGDILKAVSSVLIEIDESFSEQSRISFKCLTESGLVLKGKHGLTEGSSQCNQLWIRE